MSDRKARNVLAAVLGCAMLAAGTTVSFAAAGSTEPTPSDTRIANQVMQTLTREMPNSFVGLKVETENGVVTLSGRADTGLSKLKAVQKARQVPGVTDVKDKLRISM